MTEKEFKSELWRARKLLNSYMGAVAALDTLPDQIRMLELGFTAIRSAITDQTPVQGGGNKREEALNDNILTREDLEKRLEMARLTVKVVDRAMEALNDEDRRLLEIKYIYRQRNATERLRREYCFSDKRSVYKIVDRALERFALAAYYAAREEPLSSFIGHFLGIVFDFQQ